MADLMAARRRILMNTGEFIPPGYKQYDYLQTDSYKSYIDTGVSGNDNTLQIDFVFKPVTKVSWAPVFGNYDGNRNNNCWLMRQGSANTELSMAIGGNSIAYQNYCYLSGSTIVGKKINVHMEYCRAVITDNGGETTVNATERSATQSTMNIYIGNFATTQSYGGTHSFYSFKITKSGKLIRNYIPVVRKSDNKAGFYDTVNCTFNPSIGTADFIAGNDA